MYHDDDLAAHVKDELRSEQCGILHERSEELGDNGGCNGHAVYTCVSCGLPVCGYHAWSLYVATDQQEMFCSVCAGVAGFERDTRQPPAGGRGQA